MRTILWLLAQPWSGWPFRFSRILIPTMEPPVTCRLKVSQSPFLHAFYNHHPLCLTIDTGAETDMMRVSPGEDVEIPAGMPFMTSNDITVRSAKREIIITGCYVASYGCSLSLQTHYAVRGCHLLRAPSTNTTVWPSEFLEIDTPS